MKTYKLLYFLIFFLNFNATFAQNYVTYTPLPQTVTTNSNQEVIVTVLVNCYGNSPNDAVFLNLTPCTVDNGYISGNYNQGILYPQMNTTLTLKFKKTVTANSSFTYKFSTSLSCQVDESKMIKVTVNYIPSIFTDPSLTCTSLFNYPSSLQGITGHADSFLAYWSNTRPVSEFQFKKTSDTNWIYQDISSIVDDGIEYTIIVSDLMPDTDYQFRVKNKCSNGGDSPWSPIRSIRTSPCEITPISNLSATVTNNVYKIYFTNATVNSQIQYYMMDYVNLTNNSTGSLTIYNGALFYYVTPPNSFKFKIRASSVCNIESDWITVNPTGCSLTNYPTNLSFNMTSMCGSVPGRCCGYGQFSWSPVSGVTKYEIEYMGVNLTNTAVPPVSGTFQTTSTNTVQPTIYACNTNQAGTWILKYRVRSQCSNGTWSEPSPWSANFAW